MGFPETSFFFISLCAPFSPVPSPSPFFLALAPGSPSSLLGQCPRSPLPPFFPDLATVETRGQGRSWLSWRESVEPGWERGPLRGRRKAGQGACHVGGRARAQVEVFEPTRSDGLPPGPGQRHRPGCGPELRLRQ